MVKNTFFGYFEGFWSPWYLMSKLTSICVNLIMSIYYFFWTSSIVHVFEFLTFDIFLTNWHIFWHTGNRTHGQWGIMVNTLDRDGAPWRMGHMGDRHISSGYMWTCAGSCAIGHMGNGKHSQRGIMVNTADRDGAP